MRRRAVPFVSAQGDVGLRDESDMELANEAHEYTIWELRRRILSLRAKRSNLASNLGMIGYVYIMTNDARSVLYTGVMSNVKARVWQHRTGAGSVFAGRYRVKRLVYVEVFPTMHEAISREKQIKGGSRARKAFLITKANPEWRDLFDELVG